MSNDGHRLNRDLSYISHGSQEYATAPHALATPREVNMLSQKLMTQAELVTLSQKLTALFREKLQEDSQPSVGERQSYGRRNQGRMAFENTPPFSISPKEAPDHQRRAAGNQHVPNVYSTVDVGGKDSEKQLNIMVPDSQMKASATQKRRHNFNPQRKTYSSMAKQAHKSMSGNSRNQTKINAVGQASRIKSQYLTVNKGKAPSMLKSSRKKGSASKSKINQSQFQNTDPDAQYEQVTQNLRESLSFFMSQDPGGSSAEAGNLDNSAVTGDLNQTHLTYQTNTDGNASSLINIKDYKDCDFSQQDNSGDDGSSTQIRQQSMNLQSISQQNIPELAMFNTFDGPTTDRGEHKYGMNNEPDILLNQSSGNPISIKDFRTQRAPNANTSTITISDELDTKGLLQNAAPDGQLPQETDRLSQRTKESSQQFNQLWRFSQSLNQQIEKYRRQSADSHGSQKQLVTDGQKDSALIAARAATQKELAQYQNQIVTLKYEVQVLQKKLKEKEGEQPKMHKNVKYLHHLMKERQTDQKLLQKLTQQEDQHQADILSKSEIIKDLTSKLKKSTLIISQLHEASLKKDKQLKETLQNGIEKKTKELDDKYAAEIQGIKDDYGNQLVTLTLQLEDARQLELELKQQVQDLKERGSDADKTKLQEVQMELLDSQGMVRNLQDQVDAMSHEISEKDARIASILVKLEQLESSDKAQKSWSAERTQMEQQLKKIKDDRQESEKLLNETILELNQRIEKLEEQLQETREQSSGQEDQLQRQLSELEEQIDLMEDRKADEVGHLMDEGEKQKRSFEKQLVEKEEEIAEYAEQLKSLEDENEDLNRQIEELNREIKNKDSEIQRVSNDFTDKEEQISLKDLQLDETNKLFETKLQEIDHLKIENEDQGQQLSEKTQMIENLTEQLERLQNSLTDMQNEHSLQRQTSQVNIDEAEQFKKQFDLLKIEQNQQELVINQQKERIAKLEEQDKQKAEAYHQVQEVKEMLEKQVEALNLQNEATEVKLSEKAEELQQVKESHLQELEALKSSHGSSETQIMQENADLLKKEAAITEALRDENTQLKNEIEQDRQQMNVLQNMILAVQESEKQNQQQVEALNQQLEEAQSILDAQKAEVQGLKEELAGMKEMSAKAEALAAENQVFKSTMEQMVQEYAKIEEQKKSLESDLKAQREELASIKKATESQSQQTSPKSDKEIQEMNKHVEKLLQEKEDLTKLILTMRQNLKGLRKVFLDQVVREGVEAQNQLSRVLQSQTSRESFTESMSMPDLNNSRLLTVPAPALDSSDDEINLSSFQKAGLSGAANNSAQPLHEQDVDASVSGGTSSLNDSLLHLRSTPSIEVSAMYRKIEAEKRKFDEGVNCMQQIQIQQTEQIKEKQSQQQKKSQRIVDLEQQVTELAEWKAQHLQGTGETETQMKKLQDEVESKAADLDKQVEANKKLTEQIQRTTEDFQAQIQVMTLGFQEELTRKDRENKKDNAPTMRRTQSEQVLEEKVKKLEYKSKQTELDFEALQQTLSSEMQKRQEILQEAREKDDKINELLADAKQLSEEMEAKEDEVMHAYQKYKKEMQDKNKEIEGLKQTIQQLMEHVSAGESKATPQELKKLRQEIEQEVLMTVTEDFMTQIQALKQQMDDSKKKHEDQMYDKDAEIDNMKQMMSQKDAKINDIQIKLDLTRQAAEEGNNNEFGDFLEVGGGVGYQVNTTTPRVYNVEESHEGYDFEMPGQRSGSKRNSHGHLYNSQASRDQSPKPSNNGLDLVDGEEEAAGDDDSPSQFQIDVVDTTPRNREIGNPDSAYSSQKRRTTLDPHDMQMVQNRLADISQTEPRSNKKMKDLTQENQRLESDVLLLQDKLEGKEKENGRLQNEVDNLRLVLSETSAQLMKNPSDKKLRELESQLKNKDVIIEQLSNQIVALNTSGNDQQQQIKKKVEARVSQIIQESANEHASESSHGSPSPGQGQKSPGQQRQAFRASKLKLSGSFLHSDSSPSLPPSDGRKNKKAARKKGAALF